MATKTREQIEDLKRQWEADPCWDLADTEGFEAHRAELQAYEEYRKMIWREESIRTQDRIWEYQERPSAEKMREHIAEAERLNVEGGDQARIVGHLRWAEVYAQIVQAELADLQAKSLAGV